MTLDEYMKRQGMNDRAFAALVNRSTSTIWRIRKKKIRPSFETMRRISEVSDGDISPNSHFEKGEVDGEDII